MCGQRNRLNRREMLGAVGAVAAATVAGPVGASERMVAVPVASRCERRRMKLGLVTWNIAKDWDLPTLIKRSEELDLAAVELRTTHAHGVEIALSQAQRAEVRKRFADRPVVLWGLGTTCEFHDPDPAVVRKNIDEARQFAQLAHDVGAKGIKVRPNQLARDADASETQRTLERIGKALREVDDTAAPLGVEVWVEMHGRGTAHPPHMRMMMDVADRPNVGAVWNCNVGFDLKDGSVRPYFELMRDKILSVHINELVGDYPYRELFALLNASGYDRYTLAEIGAMNACDDADTVRFLRYYRALWDAWSKPV